MRGQRNSTYKVMSQNQVFVKEISNAVEQVTHVTVVSQWDTKI